jgi:hypothetical protein
VLTSSWQMQFSMPSSSCDRMPSANCEALNNVLILHSFFRHKIKPLYLFEASMRAWLVTGPRWVSQLLPSIHRVIGLGFMYMMLQVSIILTSSHLCQYITFVHMQSCSISLTRGPLTRLREQVLALLWAFLLNAASSVALDISGLAARHALDFTLDVSLVRAFATFYVVYGTFRVSVLL